MIDKFAKQILPGILPAILAVALTETVYTKNLGDSGPDSPITISGILSLDRKDPGYVLITSNDTVAGYPVRRIGINPFEDISRSVRYDELKKLAASGKTATLRGWFMHVHGRAAEGMAIPLAFNLVKGG